MSIFRLLKFAITSSSSSSSRWADLVLPCNVSESSCQDTPSHIRVSSRSPNSKPIAKKEYWFLFNIVKQRAPCNLLIFGWEPQYRHLAKINAAGTTVVLEDIPERIKQIRRPNSTRIYKVNYDTMAKDAYKLLTHAREEVACAPNSGPVQTSTCKLALTNLPNEVYTCKWDVIIVDGPSNDGPEAPGRMTTIYTSSMIARANNVTTNVVIHDADRMIEKWFSREFLCEDNLVSSKGRYWNFRIEGSEQLYSPSFCSQ
ncbi:Glucuronoxylan 4-O-methyltransferase 1 [Bienertia sinuspersici]